MARLCLMPGAGAGVMLTARPVGLPQGVTPATPFNFVSVEKFLLCQIISIFISHNKSRLQMWVGVVGAEQTTAVCRVHGFLLPLICEKVIPSFLNVAWSVGVPGIPALGH